MKGKLNILNMQLAKIIKPVLYALSLQLDSIHWGKKMHCFNIFKKENMPKTDRGGLDTSLKGCFWLGPLEMSTTSVVLKILWLNIEIRSS